MRLFLMTLFRFYIFLAFVSCIGWSCTKSSQPNIKPVGPQPPVQPVDPPPTAQTATVSTVAGVNNSGSLVGAIYPVDLASDAAGNMYVSDPYNNIVAKLDTKGKLSLLAGTVSLYIGGFADGTGAAAKFNYQHGIVADAAGNVFVADYSNNRIRKITPNGIVTTLAGDGTVGNADGPGATASFTSMRAITMDASGNLYVLNNFTSIRKITPSGVVSTFFSGLPLLEGFGNLTLSSSGDFYFSYRQLHLIYKLSKAGVLSVFAGSGDNGSTDGNGTSASFSFPTGITTDAAGNVYVSEQGVGLIRKITPGGLVSTIAGSGVNAEKDGIGSQASFSDPGGMVVDAAGNIYVGDEGRTIRKVTQAGVVTTIMGAGVAINGDATNATFNQPADVVTDAAGNVFVADAGNNLIREINTAGTVSTFAGTGNKGNVDGALNAASFSSPVGIAVDASGNFFIADSANNVIRKISPGGLVSSISLFVNANGASGPLNYPTGVAVDGSGNIYYNNSAWNSLCQIGPSVISTFSVGNNPGPSNGMFFFKSFGVAVDKQGNVYVADAGNSRICKINTAGWETTIAGSASAANFPVVGNANGVGTSASFNHPKGIAVDGSGNVYIADTQNNLIRKITPAGLVTTIAGTGTVGANNGNGSSATFNKPTGLSVNSAGTVIYVADTGNNLIRKIVLQ
jgi:sugar lactone lactonase YvrE